MTLFGRQSGRWGWTLLVTASFVIVIVLTVTGGKGILNLLPLLALFQVIRASRVVWLAKVRTELALALPASAKLHGQFGFLLSAGVGLGRFISL